MVEIKRREIGQRTETWEEKRTRKKLTVDLEIKNLKRKLAEDDDSWPRKTERRQIALERLLNSISYNYKLPSS